MLTLSRIMVTVALAFEESRGVHLRTDFPTLNDVPWPRRRSYRRSAIDLLEVVAK